MRFLTYLLVPLLISQTLLAQHTGFDRNWGERVIAIVPMVGTGTYQDPRRPLFVPGPKDLTRDRNVVATYVDVSDDGRAAIVEFVARDRKALRQVLTANRADVRVFEKGRFNKADLDREAKKVKKDFDLDKFADRIHGDKKLPPGQAR